MTFVLGYETVTPINDGGLAIEYNLGKGPTSFQHGGVRPVLSLEAKRRKSQRRDDPELAWEHAGQIFAEMLGQVCYKDFFQRKEMEYQEVISLLPPSLSHCLHDVFRHSSFMGVTPQSQSIIANFQTSIYQKYHDSARNI